MANKRYEYKVERITSKSISNESLNTLGMSGWKLISTFQHNLITQMVFRRRMNKPETFKK